jgi:hypothetical protein
MWGALLGRFEALDRETACFCDGSTHCAGG